MRVSSHDRMQPQGSCRLCMGTYKDNKLIHIFGTQGKTEQLHNKIQNYIPFKVSSCNRTSAVICTICVSNINSWDNYVQYCIKAQQSLIQKKHSNKVSETSIYIPTSNESAETNRGCLSEPLSHGVSQPTLETSGKSITTMSEMASTATLSHSARSRSTYCIAKWCSNNNGKCPQVSLFRVPKNETRARQWLGNSGRQDLLEQDVALLHTKYLCQQHFTSDMFMNSKQNKLVWNAVPTLFMEPISKSLCQTSLKAATDIPDSAEQVPYSSRPNRKRNLLLEPEMFSIQNAAYSKKCARDSKCFEAANSASNSCSVIEQELYNTNTHSLGICSKIHNRSVENSEMGPTSYLLGNLCRIDSDSLMTEANRLFINSEVDVMCSESHEAMYTCTYCGEVFLVKSNLIAHQMTYHPGHSVGCEVCGKMGYRSKSEFMEHICEHRTVSVPSST